MFVSIREKMVQHMPAESSAIAPDVFCLYDG